MKSTIKYLTALSIIILGFSHCNDDDNSGIPTQSPTLNINDFVWKAMNLWYFWQEDVTDLADDRFSSDQEYTNYLNSFSSPNLLFESLLNRPSDRFSSIFANYDDLLNSFAGVSTSFGYEYSLHFTNASQTNVFGFVQYVIPNSPAANAGIERGMLFTSVNDNQLNANNFVNLLSQNTYKLGFANYDNGNFTPNNTSATITAIELTENPVYLNTVIEEGGVKIGYLVYNGFVQGFNNELITAIGQLASQNIDELVLDLRYNGGGSVRSAQYLGSMITGNFTGQDFVTLRFNQKLQEINPNQFNVTYPFVNNTQEGTPLNSLGLDHLYVLTTANSASASELIINSLRPYINVTTIGTKTVGKNVGQNPLFDSAESAFTDVDTAKDSHKWALLPITFSYFNANNSNDFASGILPNHQINELNFLGDTKPLGNVTEPLLKRALDIILNRDFNESGRQGAATEGVNEMIFSSKEFKLLGNSMYSEQEFYMTN